jgi:hypothetical protein
VFLLFSSEHVKDILRESYGDEMEEWFQKPKKTSSQGKFHLFPVLVWSALARTSNSLSKICPQMATNLPAI